MRLTHTPPRVFDVSAPARAKAYHTTRSLADYFPRGTEYFYGYPASLQDGFVNLVPPEVEELVAARVFSCAGRGVSVISFAATSPPYINEGLMRRLHLPRINPEQSIALPARISPVLRGQGRDEAIKAALLTKVQPGTFVMAQPFTDAALTHLYQIPPAISFWLNDKRNMDQYIAPSLVPKRLDEYANGADFTRQYQTLQLPYVIKVSASSSGDGVYLCRTVVDAEQAAAKLRELVVPIIVEQLIDVVKNYAIHFGIPHNDRRPIDILGVNEQLTSANGEFLGGIIRSPEIPSELYEVARYLQHEVLPRVRDMGWYGVGGFDVLMDAAGRPWFIDCNFRMTGMSAYHFMIKEGRLRAPLVTFSAEFSGSAPAFEGAVRKPFVAKLPAQVRLITLNHHLGVWRFNGAIMYSGEQLPIEAIQLLLGRGVQSDALAQIAKTSD